MRIYLIGAFGRNRSLPDAIKIGVARDVRSRLEAIQTGNHLHCRIIASWRVESVRRALHIEAKTHRRFKRLRLAGEWFDPAIQLDAIDFLNTTMIVDADPGEILRADHAIDVALLDENDFLRSLRASSTCG